MRGLGLRRPHALGLHGLAGLEQLPLCRVEQLVGRPLLALDAGDGCPRLVVPALGPQRQPERVVRFSEIWVDGELPRAVAQSGGSVIKGWNAENRLIVGRNVKPGQKIQLAIFGINGPLSNPPTNYIYMRYATLEFHKVRRGPVAEPWVLAVGMTRGALDYARGRWGPPPAGLPGGGDIRNTRPPAAEPAPGAMANPRKAHVGGGR